LAILQITAPWTAESSTNSSATAPAE
jgi:FKBP-type peptidyl-prolyl cis-trans isomerase FklB